MQQLDALCAVAMPAVAVFLNALARQLMLAPSFCETAESHDVGLL